MSDRDALLRAVLAHPDDDTPRLIFADYLEEEGEAGRAAFIRSQVALARVPEYDPLWVQARAANRVAAFDMVAALQALELPDGLRWAREPFRRGFPAAVQAPNGAEFVTHADALFAQHPIDSLDLEVVRLPDTRAFARCEWLSRLTRLTLATGLSGQAAGRLFNSPHYTRLTELHVGSSMTTPSAAQAVVRSRVFAQLTTLSCRDDRRAGGALVQELTQLADPPTFTKLDLGSNRLTADHITRLVSAPALARVEELDLGDNNLGPDGLAALAAARLPHLRSLHLMRTRARDEGVRSLAGAEFLGELRSLSLGGNNLPPAAAAALAESPLVANLRVLDLRENRIGERGAQHLARSRHLKNLIALDLSSNQMEDAGAFALAESPHLDGLLALDLYGNLFTPPAVRRLEQRFGDRVFL